MKPKTENNKDGELTDLFADIDNNKEDDYIPYLTDSTPWFISKHASATCIVDLPNIEHIAFGTQYCVIELWELRNESSTNSDNNPKGRASKIDAVNQ